jgi:hypothetical protein
LRELPRPNDIAHSTGIAQQPSNLYNKLIYKDKKPIFSEYEILAIALAGVLRP